MLKSAVANQLMENELLRERIRQLVEEKPFFVVEVEATIRTLSPSTANPYGLDCVTAAWGLRRSTCCAQRHRRTYPVESRKRGPRMA